MSGETKLFLWNRVLVLFVALVVGIVGTWILSVGQAPRLNPSPELFHLALPVGVEGRRVVLVWDPLCPFCQRMHRDLQKNGFPFPVQYLPYLGHEGSREAWLKVLREEFSMGEEGSILWLDRAWEAVKEAFSGGTPTTIVLNERGEVRGLFSGYSSYHEWKERVYEHFGR